MCFNKEPHGRPALDECPSCKGHPPERRFDSYCGCHDPWHSPEREALETAWAVFAHNRGMPLVGLTDFDRTVFAAAWGAALKHARGMALTAAPCAGEGHF